MLEAITYKAMLENIKENCASEVVVGILFCRPETLSGKSIMNSLPYYHHRSGKNIDFYIPGYGAYWNNDYLDATNVDCIDGVNWSFSNKQYVDIMTELEGNSEWRYSGESELLLVECMDCKLNFSNIMQINLDSMIRDDIIASVDLLFEKIFGMIRETDDRGIFDKAELLKELCKSNLSSIASSLPISFSNITKGKHYKHKNGSRIKYD